VTLPSNNRRDVTPRLLAVLAMAVAVALVSAACAGAGPAPSRAAASSGGSFAASATSDASADVSPAAELTPVPGGATPSPVEATGTPTQTDTEWGRIWDAVPDSFPRPGQSQPADSISGPASAAFSIGAAPIDVVATMKTGLDEAGFTTDESGPFEDGGYVLDSSGSPDGCKVQTTITPLSGTTLMTVQYGAVCPFE
jgi:hypothetical protein